MCLYCDLRTPSERPPCLTGLAPLPLVWLLEDLGTPRGAALTMTPAEAMATLGAVARDRWLAQALEAPAHVY